MNFLCMFLHSIFEKNLRPLYIYILVWMFVGIQEARVECYPFIFRRKAPQTRRHRLIETSFAWQLSLINSFSAPSVILSLFSMACLEWYRSPLVWALSNINCQLQVHYWITFSIVTFRGCRKYALKLNMPSYFNLLFNISYIK